MSFGESPLSKEEGKTQTWQRRQSPSSAGNIVLKPTSGLFIPKLHQAQENVHEQLNSESQFLVSLSPRTKSYA